MGYLVTLLAWRHSAYARSTARWSDVSQNRLRAACAQGLTHVHFSAQHEPCLTHNNTLHTLNTP